MNTIEITLSADELDLEFKNKPIRFVGKSKGLCTCEHCSILLKAFDDMDVSDFGWCQIRQHCGEDFASSWIMIKDRASDGTTRTLRNN